MGLSLIAGNLYSDGVRCCIWNRGKLPVEALAFEFLKFVKAFCISVLFIGLRPCILFDDNYLVILRFSSMGIFSVKFLISSFYYLLLPVGKDILKPNGETGGFIEIFFLFVTVRKVDTESCRDSRSRLSLSLSF